MAESSRRRARSPLTQPGSVWSCFESDAAARLTAMVGALSSAQQLVLHLRYVEDLNFREIAMVMDVSESRATELHAAGLNSLRGGIGSPTAFATESD